MYFNFCSYNMFKLSFFPQLPHSERNTTCLLYILESAWVGRVNLDVASTFSALSMSASVGFGSFSEVRLCDNIPWIITGLGISVGVGVGVGIGVGVGVGVGIVSVGISVGVGVGVGVGLDIGLDIGPEVGLDIGLDVVMVVGSDAGLGNCRSQTVATTTGMGVGTEVGCRADLHVKAVCY